MSFAGHIYDMLRRDKENRELRQNLRDRLKTDRDSSIGKYQDCYKDITPEKIDHIKNELKKKSKQDEYKMMQYLVIFLLIGIGLILLFAMLC